MELRRELKTSGLVDPGEPIVLPDTMVRWPPTGSLREALRTFEDPEVARFKEHKREFSNKDWTRQCQGIATDGSRWFVTSNWAGKDVVRPFAGIYRLSGSMRSIEKKVEIPRSVAGHVGDLDVHNGRIYVALEHPFQIGVYDLDLRLIELLPTRNQHGTSIEGINGHFAWCAIDPWNDDLLYTAGSDGFNHVSQLVAFDLNHHKGRLAPTAHGRPTTIELQQPVVLRNQGGCISPNGKIYLSSDGHDGRHGIYCFQLASGKFLGRIDFEIHQEGDGSSRFEEAQGVTFAPMQHFDVRTHLHFVLLDRDALPDGGGHAGVKDDVYLKSFQVPDASTA